MLKQLTAYRYDTTTEQWVAVNNEGGSAATSGTKLRVATLNILHDRYYFPWQAIVRSQERYTHLIHELKQLQADIVGLNEVTPSGLSFILANEWIRANYYVSDIPTPDRKQTVQQTLGAPYSFLGNLILSKIPFEQVYCWRFSKESKPLNRGTYSDLLRINLLVAAIIGVFKTKMADNSEIRLGVCAIHTTAYEKYTKARETQLQEIVAVLDTNVELKLDEYYLMGDINMHLKEEDAQIERLGLTDLWTETHPHDHDLVETSFTFDAQRNTLVQMTYLKLERRQMRLDRVFWKSKNSTIPNKRFHAALPLKVWADQPVSASDYLFISDHFGLYLDITTDPDRAIQVEPKDTAVVDWPQKSFSSLAKRGKFDAGLGMVSAVWTVAKTRIYNLRRQ